MNERNLAGRIFRARREMERKTGRAERPTALVIHPDDWMEVLDTASPLSATVGLSDFMGIPVATDPRRDRGAVALTWIVEV